MSVMVTHTTVFPTGAVDPREQIPVIDTVERIGHINRERDLVVGGLAHCLGSDSIRSET